MSAVSLRQFGKMIANVGADALLLFVVGVLTYVTSRISDLMKFIEGNWSQKWENILHWIVVGLLLIGASYLLAYQKLSLPYLLSPLIRNAPS